MSPDAAMIKRLLRRWLDVPTPHDGLAETLAITIRCARRCAYDLAHAADFIPETGFQREWAKRYRDRADHWQSLFSSGASIKDYRLQLHADLEAKEATIAILRAELRTLGHSGYGPREVPF